MQVSFWLYCRPSGCSGMGFSPLGTAMPDFLWNPIHRPWYYPSCTSITHHLFYERITLPWLGWQHHHIKRQNDSSRVWKSFGYSFILERAMYTEHRSQSSCSCCIIQVGRDLQRSPHPSSALQSLAARPGAAVLFGDLQRMG